MADFDFTKTLRDRAQVREAAVHELVKKLQCLRPHLEKLVDLDDFLADLNDTAVRVDDEGKLALGVVGRRVQFVCNETRQRVDRMLHDGSGSGLCEFQKLIDSLLGDTSQ